MNIDNLIERLIHLKSQGAELVTLVDSNWNDYEIDAVELNNGSEAMIQISTFEV